MDYSKTDQVNMRRAHDYAIRYLPYMFYSVYGEVQHDALSGDRGTLGIVLFLEALRIVMDTDQSVVMTLTKNVLACQERYGASRFDSMRSEWCVVKQSDVTSARSPISSLDILSARYRRDHDGYAEHWLATHRHHESVVYAWGALRSYPVILHRPSLLSLFGAVKRQLDNQRVGPCQCGMRASNHPCHVCGSPGRP